MDFDPIVFAGRCPLVGHPILVQNDIFIHFQPSQFSQNKAMISSSFGELPKAAQTLIEMEE
jgi:hypothetical protein